MNEELSWKLLLPAGVAILIAGQFFSSVLGLAMKALSLILIALGIVALSRALGKNNKGLNKEITPKKLDKTIKTGVLAVILIIAIAILGYLTIPFRGKDEKNKPIVPTEQREQKQNKEASEPINDNTPSKKNFTLAGILVGHWRNDTEKKDYVFCGKQSALSVIGKDYSWECTYEIDKTDESKNYLSIWFKCPQPDWPGYAEYHTFEFLKNRDSFVDTMYIQGIASRVDGQFNQIGTADTCSDNWNN